MHLVAELLVTQAECRCYTAAMIARSWQPWIAAAVVALLVALAASRLACR